LNDPEGQKNHGWTSQGEVKPAGQYLTLNTDAAKKYGLAQAVVNGYDELCELEGVSPTEVKAVSGDWLTALARFLADPLTSVILVMIGVTCLILELKMPGVSLPGVIAAVCFVLFFWSHSQLNGSISWLAVLLFILGLVLIGVEIFILPGMGVSGISGVLLVIISIGLVAYGHWPQSNDEWLGYGQKLGPFGVGILVAIGLAFTLAKYLKYIPWANRLILKPQGEGADEDGESPPAESLLPELAGLLGAIGVAATPLRPAGKTQFGDQFVDVVAEGGYVRPGTRVQVIEIEGNRVVVKEV
jgi:membrane-bound ClpP family serine protease